MSAKKGINKKGGFSLVPITLSEPVKSTDGFTNLIENSTEDQREEAATSENGGTADAKAPAEKAERESSIGESKQSKEFIDAGQASENVQKQESSTENEPDEKLDDTARLTESELLRLLDADSLDEIYELSDVLRASSLKLYAALVQLADSRGRVRVKSHELMSKAGIKGIATLYKQERWLRDLKLLEKKAKPGPHDGSSYVVHKLESLPLPAEIYEKFDEYLSNSR